MLDELLMEGQLGTLVVPIVEGDGQSSVGLAVDREQIDAQGVSKLAAFLDSNSLQAYIDGACSIVRLPFHVGGRLAGLPRQVVYDN